MKIETRKIRIRDLADNYPDSQDKRSVSTDDTNRAKKITRLEETRDKFYDRHKQNFPPHTEK